MRQRAVLGATLAVAVIGLSGCGSGEQSSGTAAEEPVTVTSPEGSAAARITLSAQAEHRLGIATSPVQGAPRTGLVIPYAALVYDADGRAYAFARVGDRTYRRAAVTVRAIDGDRVRLTAGPPAGTAVVTVGAAELVGAEAGISGEE